MPVFECRLQRTRLILMFLAAISGSCAAPTARVPTPTSEELAGERMRQIDIFVRSYLDYENRLLNHGHRVLVGAAPLCEKKGYVHGIALLNPAAIKDSDMRNMFMQRISATDSQDGLYVTHTGSVDVSADNLLPIGSRVVEIDGTAVSDVRDAQRRLAGSEQATIAYVHDRSVRTMVHRGTLGCDYELVFSPTDEPNAWTDGTSIVVTRGLMRFVQNDSELAFVVAHELAHLVRGHLEATRRNAVVGGFIGLIFDAVVLAAGVDTGGAFARAGAEMAVQTYSADFEREADYVSLYILHRSGYDIGAVAELWRRYGSTVDPASIKYARTHPTSPERFLILDKTKAEIQDKVARGLPVLPEEKSATDVGSPTPAGSPSSGEAS